MPKYLCQGSYTEQGLKGLLKEGGSKRRAMVEQLAKEMGGKMESFYFALGCDDFHIILDLPSNVDMAAVAMVANASGAVKSRITVLLTPEEVDQATKGKVNFRAPTQ
ncbi:MAG: GYD domain-containing protein [Gemmatales bacterium]